VTDSRLRLRAKVFCYTFCAYSSLETPTTHVNGSTPSAESIIAALDSIGDSVDVRSPVHVR